MKLIFLLLVFCPLFLRAQDYERVAPKLPLPTGSSALAQPAALSAEGSSPVPIAAVLRGIVFAANQDQVLTAGLPASSVNSSGTDVSRVPELDDGRFTEQFAPFLGRSLLLSDLDRIKALTTNWLRAHGHPFVEVTVPPQKITSGVVQVVVTQYRLGAVKVKGARFFSSSLIRGTSGLQPGSTLDINDLQVKLDRLNRNPFLTVDAVFQPGAQTGETDVLLNAKDRLPLRVYSGFDNLGVRSLGVQEYNAGVNWGNVFGTGQILSYQFTRSFTGLSTSHSISDTVPLPWGDQLLIFGSYGTQRPLVASYFNDEGHSGQASVRYVRLLPRVHGLIHNLQVGYDFKTTDNNLQFAGFQVFAAQAEVDQFPLVYDASLTDRWGQTAVQNTFVYSPGRITPGNTTSALSALVAGAQASYLYDRFLVTRTTPLPKRFSAISRLTFQGSNRNLPYSEQVGGGGVGSVRGYYTDTALGSKGELFSQELRLPAFSLSRLYSRTAESGGKIQVGGFFDYASLHQVKEIPDVNNDVNLSSVGFLTRYSLSRYFDLQFDLGWRLRRAPTVPERGAYGQISLTGSF